MPDACGHLATELGDRLVTENGVDSIVTECAFVDDDNAFGLARLFYWQQEQARLRKRRRNREEEELLALILMDL